MRGGRASRGGIKGTGVMRNERGQNLGCGEGMKGVGEGERGYKEHGCQGNEKGQSLGVWGRDGMWELEEDELGRAAWGPGEMGTSKSSLPSIVRLVYTCTCT